MSYARWSAESSVYVYPHVGGYIDCCGCTTLHSIAETVEHMQWHRDQGDMVPSRLLDPVTYDEHDFIAMCMTYLCREDEGHAGAHTPVRTERDQQVRDNSEVRHLEAMMRGRKSPDIRQGEITHE